MAKVKNNKKKKKFFKRLKIINWIIGIIFLIIVYLLNVIPMMYFSALAIVVLLFLVLVTYCLGRKAWQKKLIGTTLSFLFLILIGVGIFYGSNTLDFLNKIESANVNTKNYSVVVLKNSKYEKLKDLKNESLAIGKNNNTQDVKDYIQKKVSLDFSEIADEENLINVLYDNKAEAILLEDSEKKILEEEHSDFKDKEKVIYTFSLDIKIDEDLIKNVDITNEPFNVFVTGMDTYGKISTVSRSDVNMVVSVNPQTHQILFTSIPRDYYVKLHGIETSYKDKLTHAGIHGIDVSIKTVEDLLDIDINYYAKVNFTSLIKLVDTLGGIDIENDMDFAASYNENGKDVYFKYKKGNIHLNGEAALAYARERYSLTMGDLARNKHQQIILEGIIKKVLSPSVITKYNSILDSLEDNFITNMSSKDITELVKCQIKNNYQWNITKFALTGTDSYQYTYAYKNAKAYVMIPDEDSVKEAKSKINELFA